MDKLFLYADENIKTAAGRPSVTPMLISDDKNHPGVMIIPGGGYGGVCEDTEGSPIGRKFNELGYHAFILDYRTAPSRWPSPQCDAMRAMRMLRAGREKFRLAAGQLAVCGFSAGAHLAASLGTVCKCVADGSPDELEKFSYQPDVMILCYGVLSLAPWSHNGTRDNLLGEENAGDWQDFSPAENVSADTPPAFLMHTVCDQLVPFENSMVFARAMAESGRPCELMLNYWGEHGMLLGKKTLDVVMWPEMADRFMQSVYRSAADPQFMERYTNGWQRKQK